MNNPFRAPAFRVFLLLCVGILLSGSGMLCGLSCFVIAAAAWALAAATVLRFRGSGYARVEIHVWIAAAVAVVCTGMLLGSESRRARNTALMRHADYRETVTVHGIVEDPVRATETKTTFPLRVFRLIQGTTDTLLSTRVMAYYYKDTYAERDILVKLQVRDTLAVRGRLTTPRPMRNPNGFNYRDYLLGSGITTVLSSYGGDAVTILARSQDFHLMYTPVTAIREWISARIELLYPGDQADLMAGLLLGQRTRIDREIVEQFSAAGIIHILAVSGLHVGILLSLFWVVLGRCVPVLRSIIILFVLWLFVFLTGSAAPVSRAVIMATFLLVGTHLQRVTDPVNSLSSAGIVLLIISPAALYQPGFQLSFAAVLSILLYYRRISTALDRRLGIAGRHTWMNYFTGLFAVTIAAQTGTLPIIATCFGRISLVSPVTNIAAVPLAFIALATGLPAILFSALGHFPADQLAAVSSLSLDVLLRLSAEIASWSFAEFFPGQVDLRITGTYFAVILIFHLRTGRIRQKFVLAVLCTGTAFVFFGMAGQSHKLRVVMLDTGQGDAIFLRFPAGRTMLIDTGPRSASNDAGRSCILPWLYSENVHEIDILVLTHPDNDHIGGVSSILEEIPVHKVYVSGVWEETGPQYDVARLLSNSAGSVEKVRSGKIIAVDSLTRVYVLAPSDDDSDDPASNETSIALKIEYGNTAILLTGDAEENAEQKMAMKYGDFLRSDLYKAGHHGSATSSTEDFMEYVSPLHCMISCGRLNRFNHPHRNVLSCLNAKGISFHRTDIEGAIIFESDGEILTKIQWRD